MERTMSVEEKIRRAEEIYQRRKQGEEIQVAKVSINKEKKDMKLFKKMIIQMIVCIAIYLVIYTINNSDYVFSEDFINRTNEILSYDTNFYDIYQNVKNYIQALFANNQQNGEKQKENNSIENQSGDQNIETNENSISQEAIGGAEEIKEDTKLKELSQEEQDIINIKNTATFIKPIEGIITSKYGIRENATGRVPKNHTGIDIAANLGTIIKAATDGEVVLASEEGDYGKHLKIQIGEVSIIYAHCNSLYVKQGDKIVQGQEIAEVGSTGNSTGPHLHFEIRISERTVDPQNILEL